MGEAWAEASRWVDLKLLDLWSIALLQVVGGLAAGATLIAIHLGHYVALLLGLMAALCISSATVWFLGLVPGILWRCRRPLESTVAARRIAKMRWFLLIDGALVVAVPAIFTILRS